ncbi:MAG: VOC family protein [Desulfocapsaceae bacterium]
MITGVEHVAIFSSNPESLKDWYERVFEFKIVKENDAKGTYWLQAPDGMLFELKRAEKNCQECGEKISGIRHIALMTDRFEETVSRLKREKVKIVLNPTISATGGKTFFFRDPEGNIFQLIYRSQTFF